MVHVFSHILDHFSPPFYYLRNRKHVPCFYRVIETRVEVWENEKCCGNTSRRRVFPQLEWSPNWTANDPQCGPQMIPNRKWSPMCTANDPEPQMIPDVDRKWSRRKTRNGMDFASMFLFTHFIFSIQTINVKKRHWQRKLQFKYNSHDK